MQTQSKFGLTSQALHGCIRTGNFAAKTGLKAISKWGGAFLKINFPELFCAGQAYLGIADIITSELNGAKQKSDIAPVCISCGVNAASSGMNTLSQGMGKGSALTETMLRKKYAGR